MPVDGETLVKVKFRGGEIGESVCAKYRHWEHIHYHYDVMEYMVVRTHKGD